MNTVDKIYKKETEKAIKDVLHEMRNAEIKKYILKAEDRINEICNEKGTMTTDEFKNICINEGKFVAECIYGIIKEYNFKEKTYLEGVKAVYL